MEASAETVEPDESDRVWQHVVQQLEALGFNAMQAMSLADAGVDWHEAHKLIHKGCSPETAIDILL